ncbi:hypothetical protein ETAA1_33370 [Urbifossiella limnaea]|uniref:Uncharacterized protein n=1 Tax=Urbifossiella limnaea TaxID=2528023 RepID=A0A517XV27_9BACT|nr:hypothetical protein ETAA1_33370 [Urbifossiella limnaea]
MKLVQKTPLKEWVTVYFDGTKTTPEKVLKHLREKESPEAAMVQPVTADKSGVKVVVDNPVAAPGDLVRVSVRLADGSTGSARVVLPKGWRVHRGPKADAGAPRFDIQVPGIEAAGKHEGSVVVRRGTPEADVRIPFAVELVPRVEPKGK